MCDMLKCNVKYLYKKYLNLSLDAGWKGNGDWKDIWATTCHCLSTWRNKELHENKFVRPTNPSNHVLKLSEDYYQARTANQITSNSQCVIDFIRWRSPVNWVKLNRDGACKGGNIASCGGIIRGSDGEWIGGFTKFIGNCSAFVVEL